MIAFVAFFMYWSDWMQVLSRLKSIIKLEDDFFNSRLAIWKDSWHLYRHFPLAGVGLGNFDYAFPMTQTSYTYLHWRCTHNDYFQLLIETGPLPLALVASFLYVYFKAIAIKIRNSSNDSLAGLIAGCAGAVVTMLLHSLVDFNLHTTSNAFLFVLIIGLTISLTAVSKDFNPETTAIYKLSSAPSKVVFSAAFLCVILFLAVPAIRIFAGNQSIRENPVSSFKDKETALTGAVRADPGDAAYHDQLGAYYNDIAAQNNLPVDEKLLYLDKSKTNYERAITLSPSQGEYWAHYAWLLGNIHENDKAVQAFSRARYLAPNVININKLYDIFMRLSANSDIN